MCQWFIALARLDSFTAALWKDSGADTHLNFILMKTSHSTTDSKQQPLPQARFSGQTNSQSAAKGGRAKERSQVTSQKKDKSKCKGQSSKGQAKKPKEKERPSQQPVSGL